jgi:hypothetical protein
MTNPIPQYLDTGVMKHFVGKQRLFGYYFGIEFGSGVETESFAVL